MRGVARARPMLRLAGMTLAALWLVLLATFGPLWAADAQGVLKVKSTVPTAEVYLDGALLGSVPLTKYVGAGPHKIRVVADNFDPFVRTVTIEADHTTDLNATLVAGQGTVEFTGPKGAAVTVNGERYTLPTRIPSPSPGTLNWAAEAAGFETRTGTLALVKGRNHLVDVVLESSQNVVAVMSKPEGAKVFLDGKEVGVTPLRLTGIASGPHAVAVLADGYGAAYRRADNPDGIKVSLDFVLTMAGASVSFTGLGEASVVRINGVEVGTGQTVKLDLVERGKVVAEVVEGETVITSKLDIPGEGAVTYRLAGNKLVEQKPLTSQWGFWAAIGGGAAVTGATVAGIAVATQPEPPPEGDVVVVLP